MRAPVRSPRDELADATATGDVYLRRLVRAQLILSLLALTAFGGIVGALPLLLYLAPGLRHVGVLGIPVALWLLVVPVAPSLVGLGWLYQRRADALDVAFRDLVRDDA